MNRRFAPLLHLSVALAPADTVRPSVAFVVPPDTALALRRGRALLRRDAGRLTIVGEIDPGTPRRLAGHRLRFGLRSLDAGLALAADLPTERVLVWSTDDGAATLASPVAARMVATTLRHTPVEADRPLKAVLAARDGAARAVATLAAGEPSSTVTFDLAGLAPGLHTVREIPSDATMPYYVDPALAAEPIAGVVELLVQPAWYHAAADRTATIAARTEHLRYYVVVHGSAAAAAQLGIEDAGAEADRRQRVDFDPIPAAELATDPTAAQLAVGGGQVVAFRSRAAQPRRGRRRIQLMRNSEVLIEHLPSPGAEQPHATAILHLTVK